MSLNVESLQQQEATSRAASRHHSNSRSSSRATNCSSDRWALRVGGTGPTTTTT